MDDGFTRCSATADPEQGEAIQCRRAVHPDEPDAHDFTPHSMNDPEGWNAHT